MGNISVILASNDVTGMRLIFVGFWARGDGLVPQKLSKCREMFFSVGTSSLSWK